MTEYDYSPEAQERYKAKLQSIGKWVHNTEKYELANPFVSSPAPRSARLPGSDTSYTRHSPHRSYTAPPRGSSSSSAHHSSSSQVQYQQTSQIYAQPQQYTKYPQTVYPYPVSTPVPARQYAPPQRSHTFVVPPPPPPPPLPPQRPFQPPRRSNTIGGYGYSPQMIYDPRVGASRAMYPVYQSQPPTPSKRWFGKLFSGFRSSSPSPGQSPLSPTGSRQSQSKSSYHAGYYEHDRDRDRERSSGHHSERRSKSHSRSTSKHHKSRSSSL
ncbi:hypothetical protein F5876DRAFT_74093 [Lentinula aff. lateritia]|uniref:Uncharacterized protein n=1 Tax=Lentinula aff. lateritia TaxID=2804960 RepID=A0ACC1U9H2_9AGAR|nr:hypothetical protein F5876DRAFT_74093 [Lentinula aff. lateritia]